ncbi:MAG: DUF11 domain-containing protein, partial [Clostridium sp.]|nr:DUF11 domain-containing protein [Clostridium sp.]
WDILTYTITIENVSFNTVKNINLYDDVPKCTKFLDNSIKINNVIQYGKIPDNLYIGNLKPGEEVEILFDVVILESCSNNEIINYGKIEYDFIYNVEEDPCKISIITNKVITLIKCNIFKEISKRSSICLNRRTCEKIKICTIVPKIHVIKTKIINTLTGKKVLIIWKIEYEIYYYRYNYMMEYFIEKIEYVDYFSTIMDIPPGLEYEDVNSIKIVEEDCDYTLVEECSQLIIGNIIMIYKTEP